MFGSAADKFFRFGRFLGTNGLEIVALPSQYHAAQQNVFGKPVDARGRQMAF